jgi:biotin carboxyl carrier protein
VNWIVFEHQGRRVRLAVARSGPGVWVGWPGGARYFGPEGREAAGSSGARGNEVRAPMTGKVVRVAAAPGRKVAAGEVLVVLEAMKMEYRLVAPREGTVESVRCREGERVDLGATLVTLGSAPEGTS